MPVLTWIGKDKVVNHHRDVPYRVLGGTKFYDRKEIKDMMAYLRLVLNPADDLAFVRIINEPKRSVGAKTLEKLQILAQQRQASLFELLTDDEVISGLSAKAGAWRNVTPTTTR